MKVYETAKAEVNRQISLRLTILRAWMRDGIPWRLQADGLPERDSDGERVAEYFPRLITHFSRWSATHHSPGNLHREFSYGNDVAHLSELREIGRSTFYQAIYLTPRETAEKLLPMLVQAAELQLKSTNKQSQIEALNKRIQVLKSLVDVQESEAREMRMQLRKEVTARRKSERTYSSNVRQLKSDNDQLRSQVATLTAVLNQVHPLRAVPKKRHD